MVRIPIITKYVPRGSRKSRRCKEKQQLGREVAWIPSDPLFNHLP